MKAGRDALLAEARATLAQPAARADVGAQVAQALSDGTAALLTKVALPARVAVLAQGGLARRELAPESDIDLCVLVDDDAPGHADEDAARALTPLWDAGLRLALSVRRERDVPELFADVAGKAGHAATALIEARFVAGDEALARRVLRRARREHFPARRDELIAEKRTELHQRRAKFGASPFHNEPDIKSGAGGLRDLHTLAWIGLLHAGEGAIDVDGDWLRGLLAVGRLSESEALVLRVARSTLLRLRAALHLAVARPDD